MDNQKQISSPKITYITPSGLSNLVNELDYLRSANQSLSIGNFQDCLEEREDNGFSLEIEEYISIEDRIQEIENLLSNYQLITPGTNDKQVFLGDTVVIQEKGFPIEKYKIVEAAQANPAGGFISIKSPLGKALIGKKVGERVEIRAPGGIMNYRVVAVQ